jgi:putative OPT family oligopeptide transporter
LVKLGVLADMGTGGGRGGWNPDTHTFADFSDAIYWAYVRQIGAGAVAAGGFITLLKTLPTIVSSFKSSLGSLKSKNAGNTVTEESRTEKDLSLKIVGFGSLGLILIVSVLPFIPGDNFISRLLVGVLIVVFGALFVTVSSRIVGLIGSSNNPISGMTIATILGTCLIFIAVGWTGRSYEPMVLVVGGMICIAAANAGATSQDLKTGYIIGATPRYQQLALFIGVIVSSLAIGVTIKVLDTPTPEMVAQGIHHAIGQSTYAAPQATLMATLIKGVLSFNLDWQYVLVGVFVAVVVELCGIKALSFAIGLYLPLATTLPIFIGGAIRGIVDWQAKRKGGVLHPGEEDLGRGNLFATGLVAGGAIAGVIVAFLSANDAILSGLKKLSFEDGITNVLGGALGYEILGVIFFATLGMLLYKVARKK